MDTPSEQSHPSSEAQEPGKDRAFREWMLVAVGLTGLLSILAVIVSVVALSSTNPSNGSVTVQAAPAAASHVAATPVHQPESVKVSVKADDEHGRMGPDHQWHDAFLPADFSVHAGDTVTVTVLNYDSGPHTFTAPSLNLNAMIPGGGSESHPVQMTFHFTAPSKAGKYQWWCAVPCDPWAMSHDGYMRGFVTVTA